METNLYKKFAQVLSDVEYLVERNEFEIFRLDFEKNPKDFQFKWNAILTSPNQAISSNNYS